MKIIHHRNHSANICHRMTKQIIKKSINKCQKTNTIKAKINPLCVQFMENYHHEIFKASNLQPEAKCTLSEPKYIERKQIKVKKYGQQTIHKENNFIKVKQKNYQPDRKVPVFQRPPFFQTKLIPLEHQEYVNWDEEKFIEALRKKKSKIQQMINLIDSDLQENISIKQHKENRKSITIPQFTTNYQGNIINFEKKKNKFLSNSREKGKIKPQFNIVDKPRSDKKMQALRTEMMYCEKKEPSMEEIHEQPIWNNSEQHQVFRFLPKRYANPNKRISSILALRRSLIK